MLVLKIYVLILVVSGLFVCYCSIMSNMLIEKMFGWWGMWEIWIQVVYEVLLNGGIDVVKVMLFVDCFGLFCISFYGYFLDCQDLFNGLIILWQLKNMGNLIQCMEVYVEIIMEVILNVFDFWFLLDFFDLCFEFVV